MKRIPVIGVIGAGSADPSIEKIAFDVGGAIGEKGCHLICGGRSGVMEAACRGHRDRRIDQRCQTIGVLPGTDSEEANEFVDIVLPTGLGLARNTLVVNFSQALIAVSGGSGTLSEIAFAWQLGKPIAAVSTSGGWAQELSGQKLDEKRQDSIFSASSAQEAIRFVLDQNPFRT